MGLKIKCVIKIIITIILSIYLFSTHNYTKELVALDLLFTFGVVALVFLLIGYYTEEYENLSTAKFKIKFKDFKDYYYMNPRSYVLDYFIVYKDSHKMYFSGIDHIKYLLFRMRLKQESKNNEAIKYKQAFLKDVQKDIDKFKEKIDMENKREIEKNKNHMQRIKEQESILK